VEKAEQDKKININFIYQTHFKKPKILKLASIFAVAFPRQMKAPFLLSNGTKIENSEN